MTPLAGHYCTECGQHSHEGTATLGHFFHDLTHELLHVDGKIFRSLKALFFQPGRLTTEYWQGRIVSWIRPVRLFLIAAALQLVFAHHTVGPLNFRVLVAANAAGERAVVVGQDLRSVSKPGYQPVATEEQERFFERFRKAYTGIRYLSVLGFAAVSWLVYRRHQPYFINHLVLGLHYYAFWYLIAIPGASFTLSKVVPLPVYIYLLMLLRRVYSESWLWSVLKTMALSAALILIEVLLGGGAISFALRGLQ